MRRCELSLDWLSFTYKCRDLDRMRDGVNEFDVFRQDFPEFDKVWDETVLLDHRSSFYDVILGFNDNIMFQYNNENGNMGVNVSVPSHGLEWLFDVLGVDRSNPMCVYDLLDLLVSRGCQLSRIDLCFDDYAKKYRPKWYAHKWTNSEIKTKFRRINLTASTSELGYTFYLGSRKTGKLLRIYDKDFESKGEKDCVRYEFELHGDYAREMCAFLIENRSLDFPAYLRSYFIVLERGNSKMQCNNRAHLPVDKEWDAWLESLYVELEAVEHKFNEEFNNSNSNYILKIPHYIGEASLNSLSNWINNQVLNSCLAYVKYVGLDLFEKRLLSATVPKKYEKLLKNAKRDRTRSESCSA